MSGREKIYFAFKTKQALPSKESYFIIIKEDQTAVKISLFLKRFLVYFFLLLHNRHDNKQHRGMSFVFVMI